LTRSLYAMGELSVPGTSASTGTGAAETYPVPLPRTAYLPAIPSCAHAPHNPDRVPNPVRVDKGSTDRPRNFVKLWKFDKALHLHLR
jgi:hypothetical protein